MRRVSDILPPKSTTSSFLPSLGSRLSSLPSHTPSHTHSSPPSAIIERPTTPRFPIETKHRTPFGKHNPPSYQSPFPLASHHPSSQPPPPLPHPPLVAARFHPHFNPSPVAPSSFPHKDSVARINPGSTIENSDTGSEEGGGEASSGPQPCVPERAGGVVPPSLLFYFEERLLWSLVCFWIYGRLRCVVGYVCFLLCFLFSGYVGGCPFFFSFSFSSFGDPASVLS